MTTVSPIRPRDDDDASSPPRGKRSRHKLEGEALEEEEEEERMEQEEETLFGRDSDDEVDEQPVPHDDVANNEPLDESYLCEPCGSSDPFIVGPDCGRVPKSLTSPIKPSAADVDTHYITHLPFRSWCPVCQAAKMREDPHWRTRRGPDQGNRRDGLPIISMDYQEFDTDDANSGPSPVAPGATPQAQGGTSRRSRPSWRRTRSPAMCSPTRSSGRGPPTSGS